MYVMIVHAWTIWRFNMKVSNESRSISLIMSKINGLSYRFTLDIGTNPYLAKVLYALELKKNTTQRQISENTGMPKQTVNKIVSALKLNGYIVLNDGITDKREKNIALTDSGIAYQNKMLNSLIEAENRIVKLMGEEAYNQLLVSLEKYCDSLEKIIGEQK